MGGGGFVIRMEEEERKEKKKADAKSDQETWTISMYKHLLFGSQNSDEVYPITPTFLLRW